MAIAQSGALDLSSLATEVGASTTNFDLSTTNVRRLAGTPTGALDLSDARGGIFIGASENATNVFTKAGSPGTAAAWRVVVNAGVTVGSTSSATPAMSLGNFPAGSTVNVDVYGTVQGAGGAAGTAGAGGAGGMAIQANTSTTFTKNITIQTGGIVRGGGGGGGKGGTGGTGGQGGAGSTVTDSGYVYTDGSYMVRFISDGDTDWFWAGVNVTTTNYIDSTTMIGTDGATYYRGTLQSHSSVGQVDPIVTDKYQIRRVSGSATVGGAGGGGGAGGNGGRGQGHDGANAAGSAGAAGAAGSAGGTNAGAGGQGGTGGTGGSGGGWGASGGGGNTGATGNTGAAGNAGSGSVGTGGAAGSGGGAAGSYVNKGGQTVTVTNNGTVNGNLT